MQMAVANETLSEFNIVLQVRIELSTRSTSSCRSHIISAFLFPSLASLCIRGFENPVIAVSQAEKHAANESSTKTTDILNISSNI
jgi:hypothetical protein